MSDDDKTGGPAFPRERLDWSDLQSDRPELKAAQSGMTLRDYFAAKALGMIHGSGARYGDEGAAQVAEYCYRMADAMLKARQS